MQTLNCDILECLHAFEVRFCNKQTHTCRFFHSLTTIFIDEETIWFKNKTYIFVMIRAIFFGSNDLVSGSAVAVQEKNIYHELIACSFKEIAFVITLVNKNN